MNQAARAAIESGLAEASRRLAISPVRVNLYMILEGAMERAATAAIRRANKYADKPIDLGTETRLLEEFERASMDVLCDIFEMGD